MPKVELERAGVERRGTLANLIQLYTHDFSDFWTDRPDGKLGEDGRFPDYIYLDSYWTDADREPLLIRADGELAGFALINTFAHSGLPVDHAVAEFFVARKYRRAGVGRAAALSVIRTKPGQWELAVARRNTAALPFWRFVAGAVAGTAVTQIDRDDELWNGPILRFNAPGLIA